MASKGNVYRDKSLKRSQPFVKHFKKSIEHIATWSNSPVEASKLIRLAMIFSISLRNIRINDIKDCELTEFNPISTRVYLQMLFTLYLKGKTTRTRIYNTTGLTQTSGQKYLIELLNNGYVSECVTKRLKHYPGRPSYYADIKEIELTTKGYDFLNVIFKILIPEDLL